MRIGKVEGTGEKGKWKRNKRGIGK